MTGNLNRNNLFTFNQLTIPVYVQHKVGKAGKVYNLGQYNTGKADIGMKTWVLILKESINSSIRNFCICKMENNVA